MHARHKAARSGQHGTARHSTAQHSTPQHSTAQHPHRGRGERAHGSGYGGTRVGRARRTFQRSEVHGLENILVQLGGLRGLVREPHLDEGVGHTLHAHAHGSVPHVGLASLRDGVEVEVNDLHGVGGGGRGHPGRTRQCKKTPRKQFHMHNSSRRSNSGTCAHAS